MNASFYSYSGKCNVINKPLTLIKSITITPYAEIDDENPYIILEYDSTIENANYCILDNVCYFIEVPIKNIGNRLELKLVKDLLTTYKTVLANCEIILDRNSTNFNSYIHDDMQKTQVNYTTFSIPLASMQFSGNSPIIVALIGGS